MIRMRFRAALVSMVVATGFAQAASLRPSKKSAANTAQLRADYVAQLQQQDLRGPAANTIGSLWSPDNSLGDLSSDYKAHRLNDTITILVAVQTTAAQTGNSSYQRTVQTSSAITGLAGSIKTSGLDPLFNANSATALKGAGATDSNTTFQTTLTGQVIAVLPSGNLVIEAQRSIFMNHQTELVTVRGVVRPNDIGPTNTVSSASLSNLEVEMKGKGIIADSTRPLNPITKAILWLVGF